MWHVILMFASSAFFWGGFGALCAAGFPPMKAFIIMLIIWGIIATMIAR